MSSKSSLFAQFYIMIATALLCSVQNCSATKVVITQSNANIDAKPIINFAEVQFLLNGHVQSLPNSSFSFESQSANFPASLCNNGILLTAAGNDMNHMCKSGNDLATQTMTIDLNGVSFNKINFFNVVGKVNPAGLDLRKRINNARFDVLEDDVPQISTRYFGAYELDFYQFHFYDAFLSIPTGAPSRSPAPSSSPKPTVSFAPTQPTRSPTKKPSRYPTVAPTINPTITFVPTIHIPDMGARGGSGGGGSDGGEKGGSNDDQAAVFRAEPSLPLGEDAEVSVAASATATEEKASN